MERLYLDHAATTPVRPEAVEAMLPFFATEFANPSSMHASGQRAGRALASARRRTAEALGTTPDTIIFTAGGSEADSLAIFGVLNASTDRLRFITSAIEHHAVLHAADSLRERGHDVVIVPVNPEGFVDEAALAAALDGRPALVSIMHGNNEIGTVQDIARIAALTHERNALFHTDAVQTVGHIPVDVRALGVDALSLSAHKFEGPKGTGVLYARKDLPIRPLVYGGGQEGGRRSGTENVAGAVGLSIALALAVEELPHSQAHTTALRDALIDGIGRVVPRTHCNGPRERRLPNNVNLRFDDIEGDTVVVGLDIAGIEISTGSACSSGSLAPSHVLEAIGLDAAAARGSIRMSLGRTTTHADIARVLEVLPPLVERLRGLSGTLTLPQPRRAV